MDTRKLEILKTDTYAMLSLAEPGQGGSVITRLELENIEAMREVRRRYNAYPELLAALQALVQTIEDQAENNFLNEDADEGEENDLTRARAAIANAINTH